MLAMAAEPELVAAAEPLAVAEALDEPPEALLDVLEAVVSAEADVCAKASAVALRLPHCSFSVQFCCAWASLGLLAMH